MSIIKENILSVAEYLEIYNQDESVEEDIILGAIHDATITLDAICGGKIALVWDITDPDDPNFRTEYEHNLIKQAHAIQAHEGVSRNLDFTGGSESYSSGSNNYNQSRTTPNVVADEIIYQLLAQARVYNPNVSTDTNIGGIEDERNYYDPTYDPSDNYLTIAVGDNRYIHKVAEDITGSRGKFLKYDLNGNITYVSIQEIVGDDYYTKEEVDYLFTNYYTIQAIDQKLAEYYNGDEIDALFANYYTKLEIDGMFANIYTKTQVDTLLNAKQNTLTAGENITIAQVGDELVISATTEPIGSVAFADITGQPTDNANLGQALNSKALASDLTTEILARQNQDTQLGNRISTNETAIEGLDTRLDTAEGNISTLQTQVNAIKPTIMEITAHQTVNTYEVPTLTAIRVQMLYNSVVAGRTTIIHFDPSDLGIDTDYVITQATNVSGVAIRFIYNDTMILTYTISGDNVVITYKEIGGTLTQQQADWNQTDSTKVDYIKNKPTIPTTQHLYKHHLTIKGTSGKPGLIWVNLYNTSNEPINTIYSYFDNVDSFPLIASGSCSFSSGAYDLIAQKISVDDARRQIVITALKIESGITQEYVIDSVLWNFSDLITQIF